MPSRVFHEARSEAITRRGPLVEAFEQWCAAFSLPAGMTGIRLLENITDESHLTGDTGFGTHLRLADFLEHCAVSVPSAGVHADCVQAYGHSCDTFALSGTPISARDLPPVLSRYLFDARWLLELLVERFLGVLELVDLQDGLLSDHEAFQQVVDSWDCTVLDDLSLTRGHAVFATFRTPSSPPRNRATRVMDALAVRMTPTTPGREIAVVEVQYMAQDVNDYRFPTVADAVWHPLFRPARDAAPDPSEPDTLYGWTLAQNGESPQPELVHSNAKLTIVSDPPHFVGTVRL